MAAKRKAAAMNAAPEDDDPIDPSDELIFTGLGGCQEVGRSCHIIEYKGKTIMLDCGMHTGREGMAAMPYFDEFDLSKVDILLVSHFHLDHTAALPYLLTHTSFAGRILTTHPTKAIYKYLISDSLRVSSTTSTSDLTPSSSSSRVPLYTESDHLQSLSRIETIDFHTTHTICGVQITPYPAGHVLGAAMFLISIAGTNVLFTGDYSVEPDRHLISAGVPDLTKTGPIDLLITESTFGISSAPPRAEREAALVKSIATIIARGGKVLLPVFALGRAQELLLILEDYWERHEEVRNVPIYYTGNTARKCMVVYQTYIGSMNENVKRIFRERMAEAEAAQQKARDGAGGGAEGRVALASAGPWDFRYVRSLRSLERFEDVGSCVMLASPGMLQSGMSRILLERWAPDPRNGVIMTGYNIEGTMGQHIKTEPEEIPAVMSGNSGGGGSGTRKGKDGRDEVMIPRRCSVEEVTFAAHVTGAENVDFIEKVNAPHVILVHGERGQAARLRSRLLDLNNKKRAASAGAEVVETKVYNPENTAQVKIPFRKDKVARVVGRLAREAPPSKEGEERVLSGVMVQNGFKLSLMAPEDLKEYAGLTSTTLICRQHVCLAAAGVDLIKWALEGTFGSIEEVGIKREETGENGQDEVTKFEDDVDEEIPSEAPRMFLIMGCVRLYWSGREKQVQLEWEGNTMNDGIADAVMAVLSTVESSPAAIKYSSRHSHQHHDQYQPEEKKSLTNGDKKPTSVRNQHANIGPEDKFSRLCMFLEEQFGTDAIIPIETPRVRPKLEENGQKKEESASEDEEELEDEEERIAMERARLAAMGVPVPGLLVKVDKREAKIWLDDLSVECAMASLKDRIKNVLERANEVVSPLWGAGNIVASAA